MTLLFFFLKRGKYLWNAFSENVFMGPQNGRIRSPAYPLTAGELGKWAFGIFKLHRMRRLPLVKKNGKKRTTGWTVKSIGQKMINLHFQRSLEFSQALQHAGINGVTLPMPSHRHFPLWFMHRLCSRVLPTFSWTSLPSILLFPRNSFLHLDYLLDSVELPGLCQAPYFPLTPGSPTLDHCQGSAPGVKVIQRSGAK